MTDSAIRRQLHSCSKKVALFPTRLARQAPLSPYPQHAHTHDDWRRTQLRRRPCSLFRARQAVAAVAVEHRTILLEPPTMREAEAQRPQHLEANLHRARDLDNRPKEMRSQLHAGRQWQTAPANSHHEADEAHSEACPRPKAACSKDLTRYVRPQHASTDGAQHSDFVPFSPIARSKPETRARRRNRQWNHRRPGQT